MEEQYASVVRAFIENKAIADKIISECELAQIIECADYGIITAEYLLVCTPEGNRGLYSNDGKLLVPMKFKEITPLGYGRLFEFAQGGFWRSDQKFAYGQIENGFDIQCNLEFHHEQNGLLFFKRDEAFYVYSMGQCLAEISDIEDIGNVSEGVICIKREGKWGGIDFKLNNVIPCDFHEKFEFKNGYAIVKSGLLKCLGLIDHNGKMIIFPSYTAMFNEEGFLRAKNLKQKWGVMDYSGNIIIPFRYDILFELSEGLIGTVDNGKVGFIDRNGNTVIPFEYVYDENQYPVFKNGVACVAKETGNDSWAYGYINHYNIPVTEFVFSYEKPMGPVFVENIKSDYSSPFGRYDDYQMIFPSGTEFNLRGEFTEYPDDNDDDWSGYSNTQSSSYDNDILDAYEGDPDAMWNTD